MCGIVLVPQRVHTHSCGRCSTATTSFFELVCYTTLALALFCGFVAERWAQAYRLCLRTQHARFNINNTPSTGPARAY